MANLTVPDLILRLTKGSPLTITEMDGDLTILRDFCNALSELLDTSLETSGSLKANTVSTVSLQDRAVTQAKLASTAMPFYQDAGVANEFAITPAPALSIYENGQVFFVRAAFANTTTTTLNVNSIGPRALRKRGGSELLAGDIAANQVFCAVYIGATDTFELIASSGDSSSSGSGSSSGYSGISQYAPPDAVLPTTATPVAFAPFTHNLGSIPVVEAKLVCVSNNAGYLVGQAVPLDKFVDAAGSPAFAMQITATNVTVTMLVTPQVADPATGTIAAITTASWQLRLTAEVHTSVASPTFPALDFTVKYPKGAFANGSDLFIIAYDGSAISTIRVNLNNSNVNSVLPAASNPDHALVNAAPFRRASGADDFVFVGYDGALRIWRMPMLSPNQPVYVSVAGSLPDTWRKPVHIEETAGAITHVLACGSKFENIQSLQPYASAAGSGGVLAGSASFTVINLRSANIFNSDTAPASPGVAGNLEFRALTSSTDVPLLFQYNRIKKRIYVITDAVPMLHIFNIFTGTGGYTDPSSFSEWARDGSKHDKLKHEKSIAIAGLGRSVSDYSNEHGYIDFDLTTGEERAIVLIGDALNVYSGSVTRIPWKE